MRARLRVWWWLESCVGWVSLAHGGRSGSGSGSGSSNISPLSPAACTTRKWARGQVRCSPEHSFFCSNCHLPRQVSHFSGDLGVTPTHCTHCTHQPSLPRITAPPPIGESVCGGAAGCARCAPPRAPCLCAPEAPHKGARTEVRK